MPHVAIIGAGPAGSTAAILLSRADGFRVTLVEQHRFPRDKVCGECLSATGIDVLRRLGLSDRARELDPVVFTRTNLFAPNGSATSVDLPRPMWGIARTRFDTFLLGAARDAGARALQPARCEHLDGAVTVRMIETNALETLRPDFVLLADGKAALLPALPAPSGDFGIKAHFSNVDGPRDAVELFGVRGCYGGLAAVDAQRWNAAFAVPASRLRACGGGDVDRLFAQVVAENAALRLRLRGASRVTDWLASPLPRFPVTRAWPANVIPLGNAAAALEPIGGEGMGLAMRSAELVAEELIRSHRQGGAPRVDLLRAGFQRLWRTRRLACRAAGVAISTPRLANLGLRATPRALASLALRLTGKSR